MSFVHNIIMQNRVSRLKNLMAEPTKTTRRDFLSGKCAVEALGDAVIGPPQPLPPPKTVGVQPGSHLLSVSREAMACLFEVVFDAAAYRDGRTPRSPPWSCWNHSKLNSPSIATLAK